MAITTLTDLIDAGLTPDSAAALTPVTAQFRLRITDAMAQTTEGVARQFVPSLNELLIRAEELVDPIGDRTHEPVEGLTHRYPDRVILHATQTCEVYCRFCFRRETVGASGHLSEAALQKAIDYIAATPAVWEVILTGGDPMTLSPRRLTSLIDHLAAIPHVEVIRFHTRVPVVAPDRITDALIAALKTRPAVYVVIHSNHPAELTEAACAALARLAGAGIPLLSQSVLLKGVNDDAATLEALFRALTRNRVKPYYLHHADLAKGTSHFRTTIAEGQALMATLRGRLSGICLPTYVLDIPGGYGKVPIGPNHLAPQPAGYLVDDPNGNRHTYSDLA
ncbi:MAG: lysine-2,3-aminomutase-like protein [Candidatus Saccharibacteria bacterium]|nr:lysine-2,3-aminomutase-like protein [Pseudorhodobacter sp.]